jgi:hypothetical protein
VANWTPQAIQELDGVAKASALEAVEVFLKLDAIDQVGFNGEPLIGCLNKRCDGYLVPVPNARGLTILMAHTPHPADEKMVISIQRVSMPKQTLLKQIAHALNISITHIYVTP